MDPYQYIEKTRQKTLEELFALLRFPSISSECEHQDDVRACAEWLSSFMNQIGIEARCLPTGGHPVVYGQKISNPDKPTVLYYGHYDVQPVEPLAAWNEPPFAPVIRGDYIMARGAADNKGQLFTHLKAIEAYTAEGKELPVNVKFIIEGEEETEEQNIVGFLEENSSMLRATVAVISDGNQFAKGQPAVTLGLRGISIMECEVIGPSHDLHSGTFGGAVPNPIHVLSRLIASFHDKKGKVQVEGFYDDVAPLSEEEKEQLISLPFDEKAFLGMVGSAGLHGESGFSVYEQIWTRPTLEINGIKGGYGGEGSKTIIPSQASCKITARLVPKQDDSDIADKIEKHIWAHVPHYVDCQVKKHAGTNSTDIAADSPWLKAASIAIQKGFGIDPVFIREGGTIPIVSHLKRLLGIDTLLIGWGQSDDNAHAPNERFSVPDFHRACRSALALLEQLGDYKISTRKL